jgi:CIC family chloride channel protein
MTEKIARRGIATPDSFEPDLLQKMTVAQVAGNADAVINENTTVAGMRDWLSANKRNENSFIVVNDDSQYAGIVKLSEIYNSKLDADRLLKEIVSSKANQAVNSTDTLRQAVERMSKTGVEVLPVLNSENKVIGVLAYKDVISAYSGHIQKSEFAHIKISLKRRRMKMLVKSRSN